MTTLIKLLLLTLALVDSTRAGGMFSLSCEGAQVYNGELWAYCRRINGSYMGTSFNLAARISNENGRL